MYRDLNTRQPDKSELTSNRLRVADHMPLHANIAQVVNEERQTEWRGPDRRKPSFKSFVYGAFHPRRRRIRRDEDRDTSEFMGKFQDPLALAETDVREINVGPLVMSRLKTSMVGIRNKEASRAAPVSPMTVKKVPRSRF